MTTRIAAIVGLMASSVIGASAPTSTPTDTPTPSASPGMSIPGNYAEALVVVGDNLRTLGPGVDHTSLSDYDVDVSEDSSNYIVKLVYFSVVPVPSHPSRYVTTHFGFEYYVDKKSFKITKRLGLV